MRILDNNSDNRVRRGLKINCEQCISRGGLCARSNQTELKLFAVELTIVYCVANRKEARNEAAEGGVQQERSYSSNLCVVGGKGVLRVRLVWLCCANEIA